MATYGDTGMYVHKGMGLVSQVFTEADMDTLKGESDRRLWWSAG